MADIVLIFFVGLSVWGPLFTIGYYAQGGEENKLHIEITKYRCSKNALTRCFGSFIWLLFDKTNRWVISIVSFALLFVLKMGGFL